MRIASLIQVDAGALSADHFKGRFVFSLHSLFTSVLPLVHFVQF